MNCIFCRIIKGEIPCLKVFETTHTFAFLDINPLSRGHVLVIPKYHGAQLHDIPDESLAEIGPILKKIAKALPPKANGQQVEYNILQNNGKLAHQEVEHVHFHVIPKPNETEGLGIKWPSQQLPKETLAQVAEDIKSRIEAHNVC